jgi:adenylate kinase family enzyme
VHRVSVVGNSGSGKTTLARTLASKLDTNVFELDSIFHRPNWQALPREEFRAAVSAAVADERWVVDGNYSAVIDIVWARADTVVWLDYPRGQVMRQVIGRTLRRLITREELWNGNREPLSNLATLDPQRSILAWAWTQHAKYRQRFTAAMADPANEQLTFVRLRNPGDARAFVASLTTCQDSRPRHERGSS